jgi:hypothetical protein
MAKTTTVATMAFLYYKNDFLRNHFENIAPVLSAIGANFL